MWELCTSITASNSKKNKRQQKAVPITYHCDCHCTVNTNPAGDEPLRTPVAVLRQVVLPDYRVRTNIRTYGRTYAVLSINRSWAGTTMIFCPSTNLSANTTPISNDDDANLFDFVSNVERFAIFLARPCIPCVGQRPWCGERSFHSCIPDNGERELGFGSQHS